MLVQLTGIFIVVFDYWLPLLEISFSIGHFVVYNQKKNQ